MTSSCSVFQDERISRVMKSFVTGLETLSNIDPDNLIYSPLKGGGSKAALYRFDIGQNSYVLRLLPAQASNLTRMHQIILAKQAGKIGLGPEIYYANRPTIFSCGLGKWWNRRSLL